jgi:hypothetical protein
VTTTVELLTVIGAHLAEFELPAIALVYVAGSLSGSQVTVQLACRAPSASLRGCWPGLTRSPGSPRRHGDSPRATPCTCP